MEVLYLWFLVISATASLIAPNGFKIQKPVELTMDTEYINVTKCCNVGEVLKLNKVGKYKCMNASQELDMEIYFTNETNHWILGNLSELNVNFIQKFPCHSYYFLNSSDNDTFKLLHNNSLYVPDQYEMENNFCVEAVESNGRNVRTVAAICYKSTLNAKGMRVTLVVFLFISILALIGITIYLKRFHDDLSINTQYCLFSYIITIAITNFLMAIAQLLGEHFSITIINLLALLIYYLILKYYVWLNMIVLSVYNHSKLRNFKNRFIIWVPYLMPIIFMSMALAVGPTRILPNVYLMPVQNENSTLWIMLLFFLPLGFCQVSSTVVYVLLKRNSQLQILWRPEMKKLNRRVHFLIIIMWLIWLSDLLVFLLPKATGFNFQCLLTDIFRFLFGFFVAIIFLRKTHYSCCKSEVPAAEMQQFTTDIN